MVQVRGTVIAGRTGVLIANTAVVGLVYIIVVFIITHCGEGLLLWTGYAAIMTVAGDEFAGVINNHLTLCTV